MSHKALHKYSGVVMNQNQAAGPDDSVSGLHGRYRQEFYLPPDYRRGTESGELRYPDLSGFQLLVQVRSGYARQASFTYSIDYQIFGLGWITVASGEAVGAPTDGKTWMTAFFDEPVEIDQTKATARWRINFTGRPAIDLPKDVPVEYTNGEANVYGNRIVADLHPYEPWPFEFDGNPAFLYYDAADDQVYFSYQQGVEKFWFASPNPLALPHGTKATEPNYTNSPIVPTTPIASDDFSQNTLVNGPWAFDSGAAQLSVIDGQLAVTSSTGSKRLYRTDAPDQINSRVTLKITTPLSGTMSNAVILKRLSDASLIYASVTGTLGSGNTNVIISKRNADGTTATLTSTATSASVQPLTDYWLRGRIIGNTITVELWPSIPAAGDTPTLIRRYTLTGTDATTWGDGVAGKQGLWLTPSNTDWRYDDFEAVVENPENEVSFCFRVLALTAERGVDFLGNEYRSVVTRNRAHNISTALGADRESYWLSKPNPSKFAVENLYFDVRKNKWSRTYGLTNMLTNPRPRNSTASYTNGSSAGFTGVNFAFDPTGWDGEPCLRLSGTNPDGAARSLGIRVAAQTFVAVPGRRYVGYLRARGTNSWGAGYRAELVFQQADGTTVPGGTVGGPFALSSPEWEGDFTIDAIAPPGASFVYLRVWNSVASTGAGDTAEILTREWALIEMDDLNSPAPGYFDGSYEGYTWLGTPDSSPSLQVIQSEPEDAGSVIDRVLVDPITPGAYFSIYYSNEGAPGVSDETWEPKLWTRIPQTYRMERRETHVLPEPVRAKYIKVEFSHLQARHYAPGNFQQSIRYKKHPKWVLDYFLARVELATLNPFLAERVAVIYDALDLAYNYYLDDLGQEPSTTVDVNNTALTQIVSFLSDRTDVSDRIDPGTLDKISLVLDTYRQHPAYRGVSQTLLGDYARQTVDYAADYATEQAAPTPITSPDVSSLNRDRVVIEQNHPVMFFFLACRHAYREVEARFTHDRAYFVGVRELAFLRDNYMTAFDTTTYIEPASDTQNIERNEFL